MGLVRSLTVFLAGCVAYDPCLENKMTIEVGVFGLVHDEPNVDVAVFPPTPPTGDAIATVRTDADGYYEIELPPGSYKLCTGYSYNPQALLCTTIVINTIPVRWDVFHGGDLVGDSWNQLECVED